MGEDCYVWEIVCVLGNCAVAFKFNPVDYGHRKLLAWAIRNFTSSHGNSVSGSKAKGGKALVKELELRNTAVSKSQIDRLKKAANPADFKESYTNRDAGYVVSYLQETGFFPPGGDVHQALAVLPILFDGFGDTAANRLEQIAGEYVCYQYSNADPNYVVSGELKIGEPTELRFAPVYEEVRIKHNGSKKLIYEGIAFSDKDGTVYMLLREQSLRHPRFYLFDDSDEAEDEVKILFGTILAAGKKHHSHLSPVCLYRAEPTAPRKPVHKDDMSPLPKFVREYLARPMAPGHSNGAPPKSLRK